MNQLINISENELSFTIPMRLWEFEFGNEELEGEDEDEIICSLFVLSFDFESRILDRLEDDFDGICADDEFAFDEGDLDLGIGGETLFISLLCFTTHGWGFYLINDLTYRNFY